MLYYYRTYLMKFLFLNLKCQIYYFFKKDVQFRTFFSLQLYVSSICPKVKKTLRLLRCSCFLYFHHLEGFPGYLPTLSKVKKMVEILYRDLIEARKLIVTDCEPVVRPVESHHCLQRNKCKNPMMKFCSPLKEILKAILYHKIK